MAQYLSLMNDVGEYQSSCGYCNEEKGSVSHGASSQRMTVYTYQDLIDHGWRRSGTWLYKPNLKDTCCKQYTIRLDVHKYQARKSQKKALKKWNAFLEGKRGMQQDDDDAMEIEAAPSSQQPTGLCKRAVAQTTLDNAPVTAVIQSVLQECINAGKLPKGTYPLVVAQEPPAKMRKKLPAHVAFTCAAAFGVAAAASKVSGNKWAADNVAHLLVDGFNSWSNWNRGTYTAQAAGGHINISHTIPCQITTAARGPSPQTAVLSTSQDVSIGPQQAQPASHPPTGAVHSPARATSRHDPGPSSTSQTKERGKTTGRTDPPSAPPATPPHEFKLVLVPATFIQQEYELYRMYQILVHNDEEWEITPARYKKFLVESPLQPVPRSADPNAPECGYGSFHQQYWLDGKLIAVGVVDILPRCLSSVYFLWHPDYATLSLGRLSALKEIEWVQAACRSGSPQLHYYYMGYYIHTCPKMKYKGEYEPSELLCPEARVWVHLTDKVRAALDQTPFLVFSRLPGAIIQPNLAGPAPRFTQAGHTDTAANGQTQLQHLDEVRISTPFFNGRTLLWKDLKAAIRPNMWTSVERRLLKFCQAAGPASAHIAYELS